MEPMINETPAAPRVGEVDLLHLLWPSLAVMMPDGQLALACRLMVVSTINWR